MNGADAAPDALMTVFIVVGPVSAVGAVTVTESVLPGPLPTVKASAEE
jgi:hypothetical protein